MNKKSVIICDDHPIVREGLKQLIAGFGPFDIIDDVSSGETLLKSLKSNKAEIVILDVSLPGANGLEVLKTLKSLYDDVNVLILSMYPEDQFALRMIKAGASGYLHKDAPPEILKEALLKIADGDEYISPSLTKILLGAVSSKNKATGNHQGLSDREYEVLLAIGEGFSLSEIGKRLNLSVKTISTYKTRVQEKLGLSNSSELVKYVMLHELSTTKGLKQEM